MIDPTFRIDRFFQWRDEFQMILFSKQKGMEHGRYAALLLLTHPANNRIGLFHVDPCYLHNYLPCDPTEMPSIESVAEAMGWKYDNVLLYMPEWWRFNMPECDSDLASALKDLASVPPSALRDEFARNLDHLPMMFHSVFRSIVPDPGEGDEDDDAEEEGGE